MSILSKWIYRFNAVSITISARIFEDTGKIILKFIWKDKRTRTVKTVLKRIMWEESLHLMLRLTQLQDSRVGGMHRGTNVHQWDRTEKSEIQLTDFLTKVQK